MKFRRFFLMSEDAMGAPPMGGAGAPPPPMGGMPGGAPPMGGPPGGDPMGGMGDPMGAPPGGAPGGQMPPTIIPKHADVWDVLDHILNRKPLEHDKQLKNQQSQPQPPAPDMGMGAGPMPGAAGMPPADPSAPPNGAGQPALMS